MTFAYPLLAGREDFPFQSSSDVRVLIEPTQDIQVLVEISSVLSQIPVEVLDAKRRQSLFGSVHRGLWVGTSAAQEIHQRVALRVRSYDRPFAGRLMVVRSRGMKRRWRGKHFRDDDEETLPVPGRRGHLQFGLAQLCAAPGRVRLRIVLDHKTVAERGWHPLQEIVKDRLNQYEITIEDLDVATVSAEHLESARTIAIDHQYFLGIEVERQGRERQSGDIGPQGKIQLQAPGLLYESREMGRTRWAQACIRHRDDPDAGVRRRLPMHHLVIEPGHSHLADYVIRRVLIGPVDDAPFLLVCQHGIASGVTIKGLSKLIIGDRRAIQQDQRPLDFPDVRSSSSMQDMRRVGYGGCFQFLVTAEQFALKTHRTAGLRNRGSIYTL